jgi:hypothetical protein
MSPPQGNDPDCPCPPSQQDLRRQRGQDLLCRERLLGIEREEDCVGIAAPKYKAGQAMSRTRLKPEDLRDIRDLAAAWGKIVARRAFGPEGPSLAVDFSALEEVAQQAAQGLTEGTLAVLLEQQANALGDEQPCPDCGQLCPVTCEPRTLHLKGGQPVQHSEPVCHCPACRRDFFPPPAGAASGRAQLQPRPAAPDR